MYWSGATAIDKILRWNKASIRDNVMLLDIHVHTSKYSPCSTINLIDAVLKAREVGLDGICVTDHDTDSIRDDATLVARETGFPCARK